MRFRSKLVAVLAAAALPALALATNTIYRSRTWSEAQALTRAAPTLVSEGLSLSSPDGAVTSFSVTVEADNGQTLTGGKADIYWWDPTLTWWSLTGGPSFTIPAGCVGLRRCTSGAYLVPGPYGRVLAAANAVTVSAGACTLRIRATVNGDSVVR